jgi:hypothetical protein
MQGLKMPLLPRVASDRWSAKMTKLKTNLPFNPLDSILCYGRSIRKFEKILDTLKLTGLYGFPLEPYLD